MMTISTGTGDSGSTSLTGGQRVSKHSLRVNAYGSVDELNSLLGIIVAEMADETLLTPLRQIQHDLFVLGADVSTPPEDVTAKSCVMGAVEIERLEQQIERVSGLLPPLREFILPGGTRSSAWLHLARTVARRAERDVVAIAAEEDGGINPSCLTYLNRLSDLLFLWARQMNAGGQQDVVWRKAP